MIFKILMMVMQVLMFHLQDQFQLVVHHLHKMLSIHLKEILVPPQALQHHQVQHLMII